MLKSLLMLILISSASVSIIKADVIESADGNCPSGYESQPVWEWSSIFKKFVFTGFECTKEPRDHGRDRN